MRNDGVNGNTALMKGLKWKKRNIQFINILVQMARYM